MAGANKKLETGRRLSDSQRLAWLRNENVCRATSRALVNQTGGAEAGDIVDALAPIPGRPAGGTQMDLSSSEDQEIPRPPPEIVQSERGRVLEALGPSLIDIDEILRCTGVETRKVHIILPELDLAGRLQRHPRQLVSLVEP